MKNLNFLRENPFKKLLENYKSLNMFYKITFILGIVMPFILWLYKYFFAFGFSSIYDFFDPYDIEFIKREGIIYILKYCQYDIYQILHPFLMFVMDVLFLSKKKYGMLVLILNILLYCIASQNIILLVVGILFELAGGLG